MNRDTARFRVLLAEDDPVSRQFLREAMGGCGADVTDCADGAMALARACAERFDLLVLDQHLPGLAGDALLGALRADAEALSRMAPAIATSAAREIDLETLLAAGFSEALPKPTTLEALREALARQGCPTAPALDDAAAVRACGSPQSVARLRRLFAAQELPNVQRELEGAAGNPQTLGPTLHRLRASCGLCGAGILAKAAAALEVALASDGSDIPGAMDVFRRALADTRQSLDRGLPLLPG